MGVNFCLKTCGWVIILIQKTSGLVTISILLPGNGWYSCKLNRTYCNLFDFGSCFNVHSPGLGLFLFIEVPALVCGWVNFLPKNLRMGHNFNTKNLWTGHYFNTSAWEWVVFL